MSLMNFKKRSNIKIGGSSNNTLNNFLSLIYRYLTRGDTKANKISEASIWEIVDNQLIKENQMNLTYVYKIPILVVISFILLLVLIHIILQSFDPDGNSRFINTIIFFIKNIVNIHTLHAVYSICKIVNILFTLIIVVLATMKVTRLNKDVKDPKHTDNVSIPFPIALMAYFMCVLPYAYDLLIFVSASSIVLIIYSCFCGGSKANTWTFITLIENTMLLVGLLGFVVTFIFYIIASIRRRKKSSNKDKELYSESIIGKILLLSSITFVVLNTLMQLFEYVVSYNASFWTRLASGNSDSNSDSSNDCVSTNDQTEKPENNSELEIVFNVFLSLTLALYFVAIIIFGMFPDPNLWIFGNKIRTFINHLSEKGLTLTGFKPLTTNLDGHVRPRALRRAATA
jgi:hypothetical protein